MKYQIASIALFALLVSGCSLLPNQQTTEPLTTNLNSDNLDGQPTAMPSIIEMNENTESTSSSETKKFTLEEIALHDSAQDCWFAIDNNVYDVTQYIAGGKHGGGDAIIEGCGKDATELFNTRPMGSGTPHSDKARSFLPNFQIGELSN